MSDLYEDDEVVEQVDQFDFGNELDGDHELPFAQLEEEEHNVICDICGAVSNTEFDGVNYCEDCYDTEILHQ